MALLGVIHAAIEAKPDIFFPDPRRAVSHGKTEIIVAKTADELCPVLPMVKHHRGNSFAFRVIVHDYIVKVLGFPDLFVDAEDFGEAERH